MCYAGSISRADAEDMLRRRGKGPGTYLLRRKGPSSLVLSVLDKSGRPKHAKLESSGAAVRVGHRTFATFEQCWGSLRDGVAKHGLRFRLDADRGAYVLCDGQ